jgi:gamma-tubulin complex component 4
MSQQSLGPGADASRSVMPNVTIADVVSGLQTTVVGGKSRAADADAADVHRHIERLLLRLDFNSAFSRPAMAPDGAGAGAPARANILKEGGLA